MDYTSVSGMVFMALEIQISVLKISDRRSVLKCPSVFPRRGLLDTGGHIPKCNRAVICRHLRILAELVRPSTKGKTCHMLHVHLHSQFSKNKECLADDFRGRSCYEGVRILTKKFVQVVARM